MVMVIDSTEMDIGKQAYSMMADFGVEPEVKEKNLLDVPGTIARSEHEVFLVIMRGDQKFSAQVLSKIMDLEEQNRVEKVVLEKKKENREKFRKRSERRTREAAEKLAGKI